MRVETNELEIGDSRKNKIVSDRIQEPVDTWDGCEDDGEIEYCPRQPWSALQPFYFRTSISKGTHGMAGYHMIDGKQK